MTCNREEGQQEEQQVWDALRLTVYLLPCCLLASGLPRDVAQGLAAQTVLGSAKMVLETGRWVDLVVN